MKTALIDLDTTHPHKWCPILAQLGYDVVGVFDHGDIHPPGFAQDFAAKHGNLRVFESVDEAVSGCDCAIIFSADWGRHVERVAPFIEAGCAVLIDKPIAGSAADLATIQGWAQDGHRITGGSSLRFCAEAITYRGQPEQERGVIHTVLAGCGLDSFNFGIHGYAMLAAILGGDCRGVVVRHVGEHMQRRVEIRWPDGRIGWVVVGPTGQPQPYHATVITNRQVRHLEGRVPHLFEDYLAAVRPFLSGRTDEPPLPIDEWLAPERWAIAALQSWSDGDRTIAIDQLDPDVEFVLDSLTRAQVQSVAAPPAAVAATHRDD